MVPESVHWMLCTVKGALPVWFFPGKQTDCSQFVYVDLTHFL